MKYNQELHELTNELDDCYKDIFHSSNLGNTYNSNLRFAVANYRIQQIRENQSSTGLNDIDNKKLGKYKDLKSNIIERAIRLEKFSNQDLTLPEFPSGIWLIITEYEGGIESSLLGKIDDNVQNNASYSWCEIL